MKKKLVGIFIIILFLTINISFTGCIEKKEVLDQFQVEDVNLQTSIWKRFDLAQSFIPTLRKISRVELKIEKLGDTNWLNLSIRRYIYDPDLVSLSIHGDQIPSGTNWINFDIEDLSVSPRDQYFIVVSSDNDISLFNNYYWNGNTNDNYSYGRAWMYDGIFEIWNVSERILDFCFKTYGYKGFESSNYFVNKFIEDNPEFSLLLRKIIQ